MLHLGSVHTEHEAYIIPLYCHLLCCHADVVERANTKMQKCKSFVTSYYKGLHKPWRSRKVMVILERNTVIQPVDFLSMAPFYVSEFEIMT